MSNLITKNLELKSRQSWVSSIIWLFIMVSAYTQNWAINPRSNISGNFINNLLNKMSCFTWPLQTCNGNPSQRVKQETNGSVKVAKLTMALGIWHGYFKKRKESDVRSNNNLASGLKFRPRSCPTRPIILHYEPSYSSRPTKWLMQSCKNYGLRNIS